MKWDFITRSQSQLCWQNSYHAPVEWVNLCVCDCKITSIIKTRYLFRRAGNYRFSKLWVHISYQKVGCSGGDLGLPVKSQSCFCRLLFEKLKFIVSAVSCYQISSFRSHYSSFQSFLVRKVNSVLTSKTHISEFIIYPWKGQYWRKEVMAFQIKRRGKVLDEGMSTTYLEYLRGNLG